MTTFQLLGIQFGVSESTANDAFNYWLPMLRELLPSSLIEQVKKKESDYEVVKEILTEYELIVDSYEQVRERPRDNKEQEKHYSGKACKHTFIGLSRNIERRWREHTRGLDRADALERGNYRLRADFLKYRLKTVVSTPGKFGVFEFKIIEKCREDKLLEREQFWIKKIKPVYNCIPWTTERERIIVGSEQKFWVQYHNYDRLGYVPADSLLEEYLDDEEYEYECEDVVPCVSTNKRAILNARGDTLFLIVGIGQNPKQYYLWSVFVIEEVEIIDEEGEYSYNAFGNGWVLDSPKLLNSASFNEFKSLCGNFGFGFMSINNFHYLEKLKHFSENYKPKTSKINFLKYVYNFYQQVIRVNPNEAARLFGDVEN